MNDVLDRLRKPISITDLRRLGDQVALHAEMLDEESLTATYIDYDQAQTIATVLSELISSADNLDAAGRELVGAAARYFVLTEDESSDLDPDGLADDSAFVALVCEQLGRSDLAAKLTT